MISLFVIPDLLFIVPDDLPDLIGTTVRMLEVAMRIVRNCSMIHYDEQISPET